MVRHIVMFQFKEEALGRSKAENAKIAKDMLEALQGVVPTLRSSYVKLNGEGADASNYDLVLVAEYEDYDGLNAYIVHPEHKKVGEFMKKVRLSRACVDFEF